MQLDWFEEQGREATAPRDLREQGRRRKTVDQRRQMSGIVSSHLNLRLRVEFVLIV